MKFLLVSTCVLLVTNCVVAEPEQLAEEFSKCLEKDSIACLQMTVFRRAKAFFDKPTLDIFGGISLKKNIEERQGKSIEDNTIAVETAKSVETRNGEMESYLLTNAKNFFQERSLNLNFVQVARSIASKIPDDIKEDVRELVVEGRLKKKKLLKKLLPIILGIAAKIALLIIVSLVGILMIAKKAFVVAVAALGLALFSGLTGLASKVGGGGGLGGGSGGGLFSKLSGIFGGGGASSAVGTGWSGGQGGWGAGGGGGGGWSGGGAGGGWSGGGSGGGGSGWNSGWDSHGAYSAPVAQTLAYSGHNQAATR